MKAKATTTILTILFGLALGASLRAANRVVQLGESIQTQVAASQAGDVVIVRAGEYQNQTISIDKPIRLVREKGTNVTIGGSLTYADVNGTVVLRDFTLLAAGKGSLSLSNCTKFGLENLTKLPEGITLIGSTVVIRDCAFTGNLSISGGSSVEMVNTSCVNLTLNGSDLKAVDCNFGAVNVANDSNVTLVNSTFISGAFTGGRALLRKCTASGNVTFTQCDWQDHGSTYNQDLTSNQSHSKLSRSTVKKAFTHGHSAHGGVNLDCVIYQSTIGRQEGHLLHSKANRTWVTYSAIHHALQTGGAEAHFIGNQVFVNVAKGNNGISLNGANCVTTVANNHFYSGNTTLTLKMSDDAEKKTTATTAWVKTKTLTPAIGSLFEITHVTNQIRNEYGGSSKKTYCLMKYFYFDGTNQDSSQHNTYSTGWIAKTYNNPAPAKQVTKIEVWLKAAYDYTSAEAFENLDKVYGYGIGVYVQGAKRVDVHNNLFDRWDQNGHCVYAQTAPADGLFVKGNAFWRTSGAWQVHAVSSPKGADRFIGNSPVPAPDVCSHNYFHDNAKGVTGGIVNNNNFSGADPGFVDHAGGNWTLKGDSILKDKGPTEPEYNDLDGSRNDVGFRGGHRYDAAGWNAAVPVVLSADQSHFRLTKGDNVPLVIKARAAVATP